MPPKHYFILGVAVLLALTAVPLLQNTLLEKPAVASSTNSSGEFQTLQDGTRYTVHPSELRQGCPGMDCIPSIDNPRFQDAGEADWMEPGDPLIGVEVNGEPRAYPLRILSLHEIVNDRIDGEPVVVTYCPLCRSGVTYSREVNGDVLEFGVSGKLLDANLVMYDRQTETYWSQIGGEAIVGPRVPQKLELRYSSITNWSSWKRAHPDTEVLSRNTGIYPASSYDSNPYAGYENREHVGFGVGEVDDRLPAKKIVYGVQAGSEAKAYPEEAVKQQKLIQDTVGGEPVMILQRPDDGTITAFSRRFDGRTLNFALEKDRLVDSRGGEWSFEGEKLDGDGKLDRIVPKGFYWFAWSKFHPGTAVYQTD